MTFHFLVDFQKSDMFCKILANVNASTVQIDFPHTWYLSFFYTGKIFRDKILHPKARK